MAFHDHTENGITVLQSDLLCGSIRHGFSTRTGGVSPSPWNSLNLGVGRGDDPANVQENFRRLCGVLGLSHQRAVLSKQVHEDNIRLVTESDCGKGLFRQRDYASVDAMICREKHIPLVVFSADCGTILLYDPVQEAIGAVHAGWRGVASGLAAKTVRRMQEAFGTEPGDLLAATGPSIGACCFETDDDVPEAMRRALDLDTRAALYFSTKGGKPALRGAASAELLEEERGDGRIPGLKKGFPGEGGSMDFDALLDRVEAGIAERLRELEAGNVTAVDPTSAQAAHARCSYNHEGTFVRRDV